jgi:hypothetical protein
MFNEITRGALPPCSARAGGAALVAPKTRTALPEGLRNTHG